MKRLQYTVRQVPEHVDAKLRAFAVGRGISLNEAALEAIAIGLGLGETPIVHHDLDEFCHTWQDDPEFEEAIRVFEMVDENLWK